MTIKGMVTCAVLAIMGFSANAQQFTPVGPGFGQRPPGFGGPGWPGGWRGGDDNFNRPGMDMEGSYPIGSVDIGMGSAFGVLSPNIDAVEIRLCASRDDLAIQNLSLLLANGQILQLSAQDYVPRGTCMVWMQLPVPHVQQILVVGNQLPGPRSSRVLLFGRMARPQPAIWSTWDGGMNSCGDSDGPFIKDNGNNQVPVPACPDQKPNGGPIGQPCQFRGQLCYGWRQSLNPGFFCSAPNGKTPPFQPYQYSIYQCK